MSVVSFPTLLAISREPIVSTKRRISSLEKQHRRAMAFCSVFDAVMVGRELWENKTVNLVDERFQRVITGGGDHGPSPNHVLYR